MKPYIVKNQKLANELRKAETAEGYLIVISRLNNKILNHSTFTQKFNRSDIPICLVHYNKLLSEEMEESQQKNIIPQKTIVKKTLPPRYRKANK